MQKHKKIQYNQINGNNVLVIGGGAGGIRAALDLAESCRNVILIDKSYSIGGLVTQLDRTFPTNNCDLCAVSPHLSESGRQHYMNLMPMTRLESLTGEAGNFTANLVTQPRYIDIDKCTACGECAKKYPEWVRFSPGLDPGAPTCMRYPQATPYAFSIDMEKVKDIKKLQGICKANAILPEDKPVKTKLAVASVVLSVGADVFDPNGLDNFGAGRFKNVVTGLQYERIMSASGPFQGELLRMSDKKRPKKVAWIQCVGSRGINTKRDVPYCSSVCCMSALKEAVVTKERFAENIETTIFYIDMRTFGKGYEQYLNRAKIEYGVRLIRGRPHSIIEDPFTKNLSITYATEDDTQCQTQNFDMVVLSTGFRISKETTDLAGRLGIELNAHQFVQTDTFYSVMTSKPGIYVCGTIESPKDIPETMVQASAAACMAAANLQTGLPDSFIDEKFIPERNVDKEPVNIGVFVCDCGVEIGGVIDVKQIVVYANSNPDVSVAQAVGYGCSSDVMVRIEKTIRNKNINRVVIAGCSPRTHETKFQDLLRRAGLNKYLLEMVNIRDQNTWVHKNSPKKALEKALNLVQMGISSVRHSRPLSDNTLLMSRNALIVGGGVTGMIAALALADKGTKVYLIERSPALGGMARSIRKTIEGSDVQSFIKELTQKTLSHENIQVLTRSIIVDHTGMPGRFTTGIQTGPSMAYLKIKHAVIILATGALPNHPDKYLLGRHEDVMTQIELDNTIEDDIQKVKNWNQIVMIQCVGSRESENPNCSRVCCQAAIKNALRIKKINPEANIYILYRDIRTYGFLEDYYREARNLGIKFICYTSANKPEVFVESGELSVSCHDMILGCKIHIAADCVALSTGFIADDETTEDLSMMFHVPRSSDNYFLEEHIKLSPVDMPVRGVYVAGTAHSPKTIRECVTQAQAAAGKALTLLAKKEINLGAAVAMVDSSKCASCLVCVRTCPFNIPFINADGYSQIDPAKCHGCGTCAADCPANAIQLMSFEDDQIMAKIGGLFERYN